MYFAKQFFKNNLSSSSPRKEIERISENYFIESTRNYFNNFNIYGVSGIFPKFLSNPFSSSVFGLPRFIIDLTLKRSKYFYSEEFM